MARPHRGGGSEHGHTPGGPGAHPAGGSSGTIRYGFVKCKVLGSHMKPSFNKKTKETQYHLHATLQLGKSGNSENWDSAINVGTDDSDDLLRYKIAFDNANDGIHDVHMNQGSIGSFTNTGSGDRGDHNRIWEDGAVFVDLGEGKWAAYFTAFTQQMVPTDKLGNPVDNAHEIDDDDDGSLTNA